MRHASRKLLRVSVCLSIAFLWGACASAPEAESESAADGQSATTSLQEARTAIDVAIGEAGASRLEQCALVAVGQRPCGGPRQYLAYSLVQTDSAELASLVEIYDRLDRERNERQGLVSTCQVLARPEVGLEEGRCVTGAVVSPR
jgi:hypothetical protein